jgi:polyisoprenoid-binding protein YceI
MARFVLDSDHASALFTVRHMMVTWVQGRFDKVTGSLSFDPHSTDGLSVEASIETASIHTGIERRDDDLKSPNYFDVEKYPVISFKSTGAEATGLDRCLVHGDLFIHGVTQPVTLDVSFAGPSHFQDDDRVYTTYGFRARARINREDFGMMTNMELEHGGCMVGRLAYLTVDAEADLVEE